MAEILSKIFYYSAAVFAIFWFARKYIINHRKKSAEQENVDSQKQANADENTSSQD